MRPSVTLTWLGSAAAIFALLIAGCKYSSLAGALPGPASAPTFKFVVLPSSTELLRAAVTPDGSAVRLAYSVEGAEIFIEERPALAAPQPPAIEGNEEFSLDGYAATYDESAGYRGVRALTWYRPDVTVTLSSRDAVSTPLLIDIALELR